MNAFRSVCNRTFWRGLNIQGLLLIGLVFMPVIVFGQQKANDTPIYQRDPANLPEAIAKVRSGDFLGIHVEMIAHFKAVEAIPALEKQFDLTQDRQTKAEIASALVRLGDKDDRYWHFLVNLALPVIVSDEPDPFAYDEHGKTNGTVSPGLVAWAQSHNMPLPKAASEAFTGVYDGLGHLADTGDPRGIPLLRRALKSPNFITVQLAAQGLAQAKDKDSIPLIIEACKRAPADAADSIVRALIFFDDSNAQNAVNTYMRPDAAKAYRDGRANGLSVTPF